MTKAYGPLEFGNWYQINREKLMSTKLSRIMNVDIEKTKINRDND